MAKNSGFFDDVAYDADDLNGLIEGVITDGVFGNVGDRFKVEAISPIYNPAPGYFIVNSGKAWLHRAYLLIPNTTRYSVGDLTGDISVVIEKNESAKSIYINIVPTMYETSSSSPVGFYRMPIARISGVVSGEVITESQIRNLVGTTNCPLVTGPLTVITTDQIERKWDERFTEQLQNQETRFEESMTEQETQFDQELTNKSTAFQNVIDSGNQEVENLKNKSQKVQTDIEKNIDFVVSEYLKKNNTAILEEHGIKRWPVRTVLLDESGFEVTDNEGNPIHTTNKILVI